MNEQQPPGGWEWSGHGQATEPPVYDKRRWVIISDGHIEREWVRNEHRFASDRYTFRPVRRTIESVVAGKGWGIRQVANGYGGLPEYHITSPTGQRIEVSWRDDRVVFNGDSTGTLIIGGAVVWQEMWTAAIELASDPGRFEP